MSPVAARPPPGVCRAAAEGDAAGVRAGCKEGLSREHRTGSALPSTVTASRTGHTARPGGSSSLALSPWFCMRQQCCSAPPGNPVLPHPRGIVLASACGYRPALYIGEQRVWPWGQLGRLVPEDDPRRRPGGRGHAGNDQAQGVTASGASVRVFSGVLSLFLGGKFQHLS